MSLLTALRIIYIGLFRASLCRLRMRLMGADPETAITIMGAIAYDRARDTQAIAGRTGLARPVINRHLAVLSKLGLIEGVRPVPRVFKPGVHKSP